MPIAAVGLGIGLIGGVGKLIQAGKANSQLNSLIGQDPKYAANPIAAQRLSLAQTLLNSRMPGAAYAERNISQGQVNQEANVERNATSGSQALVAGAAAQAQANKGYEGLDAAEGQDYQRRFQNLVGAQEGEIQEGDKVYQDQQRRFQDLAQIRGAQNQNTTNAWSSISNAGFGLANFGLAGGMKKLFPGSGQPAGQSASYGGTQDPGAYNPGAGGYGGVYQNQF
jgi:hypothetical protein